MNDVQGEFLIHELARMAEVTPRTIRYYTDEGLLPPPNLRGKYAYYNQEHFERLKLIQRMKDAYLPLREIRQAVSGMNPDEVRSQMTQPSPPAAKPQGPSGESALDYIARLTHRQAEARASYQERTPATSAASAQPAAAGTPAPVTSQPESWRRIHLSAEVELHFREPVSAQTRARIEQLERYAKQLFEGKER